MSSPTKAPSHLSPVAQQWFKQIIFDYELESQQAWDRGVQAREPWPNTA